MVELFLDVAFSGIPLTESILRGRLHSEIVNENHLLHFFWSLWCSFASYTADFEISEFNITHKVPLNTPFKIRKSLKRISSLAYTEMHQTKNQRFIDLCIRMHYLDIVARIYMYIVWLADFRG